MIIFGTKSTRKTLDSGTFDCPQCRQTRNFDKRRAKQWFHLYFIPLIPLKEYPPYVECKSCSATFVEGVLDRNADSQEIRAEFETATLKILARMAWADGIIEPEEKDAIFDVANRICAREFSRNDVDEALRDAKDSPEDALAVATQVGNMLNDAGKEMIIQAVYLIAASDGVYAKEEHEMILEIGAGLGLRPAYVSGILEEIKSSKSSTLQD